MILIIDDEPKILRIVSLALNDQTTDIKVAADAETALNLLKTLDPELMIVDVKLPGISGLDLAKIVRADPKHCDTRILLMSAHVEPRHHDADAFLSKPFDVDELVHKVEAVLA